MPPRIPDLSLTKLRDGARVDPDVPYRVGGVTFDPHRGMGVTPEFRGAHVVEYLTWLTPSEFLALNPVISDYPHLQEYLRDMRSAVEGGASVAPPYLLVMLVDDGTPEGDPATLRVMSHEGRHRMTVFRDLLHDQPVPVELRWTWSGWHLPRKAESLLGATLRSDRSCRKHFQTTLRAVAAEGIVRVRRSVP